MLRRLLIPTFLGAALLGGLGRDDRSTAEPARSSQPAEEMVHIEADPAGAISQGDTQGCGPVSLLNLLKLGPEPYRKAYRKLTGGKDEAALKRLAQKYCSPKGDGGKVRYSDENGIDDPNLSRLCAAVARDHDLPPIEALYTTRKKDESNRDFAKRVNDALVASLSRGVGVVASIDSYGARGGKWVKLTGHYVLLTGAQRLGKANPSSFVVEFVDPASGNHRQAYVYGGRRKHKGAYAHFEKGDEWLENDPYLCMASPYTDLGQGKLDGSSRHEFFLTIVFGRFRK